jgi:hypothetical protein
MRTTGVYLLCVVFIVFVVFFVFILFPHHKSHESVKIGPHPRGHPSSDAASSASSVSARTWRPAELPLPSRASARPDTGKHGRRCLASSTSSASARPWRLVELPPPSPGGAASSVTRGRTVGGAQPWRPAELPPSPAFARPVSRTRGCLLLVGPSAARPAASSSSAGLDA